MVGMPLLNLGTALGGLNKGYQESQDFAMQQAIRQLVLQQAQQKMLSDKVAGQALQNYFQQQKEIPGFGGGMRPIAQPPMPGQPSLPSFWKQQPPLSQSPPFSQQPPPAQPPPDPEAAYMQPQAGPPAAQDAAPTPSGQQALADVSRYAVGNAVPGGPSSVSGLRPEFASAIDRMTQDMPPDIRSQFAITSGFRSPEREAAVYAEQHPGQPVPQHSKHSEGVAADIGDVPVVEKWIADHPEYGLGFPLKDKPGEQNHMELLKARYSSMPKSAQATLASVHQEADMPGQFYNQTSAIADMAGKTLINQDFMKSYRSSLADAAQAIEAVAPNADPAVKFQALTEMNKLLAPDEKMKLDLLLENHKEEFELGLLDHKEKFEIATKAQQQAFEFGMQERRLSQEHLGTWQIHQQDDGSYVRVNPTTGQVEPLKGVTGGEKTTGETLFQGDDGSYFTFNPSTRKVQPLEGLPPGATKVGAGGAGEKTSKNIVVTDANNDEIFSGLAHQTKQGWVNDADGKPISVPPGGSIKETGTAQSSGGRAGAQIIRQQIGGREVLSDLQNAVNLPVGSTTGTFGQYVPGTSLLGAVRGNVSRALTSQDVQLMQASMASMTRELSILMSPVYGGNWAAQQIDPLIPKEGDTVGTTLYKLARIAQSADNALEAIEKAPILSGDQKRFAADLRQQINTAVPWTTSEAMTFARGDSANDTQTFQEFMHSHPHGGTSGQGAGTIKLDANGNPIQ